MPDEIREVKEHEVRILRQDVEFRVKEEDGKKTLQGYAAKFNRIAEVSWWFDEEIKPGAFTDTIKEDDIRALFNHDPNIVLGRNRAKPTSTLTLSEDAIGLNTEMLLPGTQAATDLTASIERGDISQMSFQFDVIEEEWIYGKSNKDKDKRTLIKVKLYDVSVATFPAYDDTEIFVRSKNLWLAGKEKKQRSMYRPKTKYYNSYINLIAK